MILGQLKQSSTTSASSNGRAVLPSTQTESVARQAAPPCSTHPPLVAPRSLAREGDAGAGDLVYVYAILPTEETSAAGLDREPLRGIQQAPVRLVVEGPLAAAVSHVPADDFKDIALDGQVPDIRWLAPRAVAHNRVNSALFERGAAVLPLSFGRALFRGEENVRQMLRREQARFLARLARVGDRVEWVVTVRRDQAAALAYLEATSPRLRQARERESARSAAVQPGRTYLRQGRLDKLRREELFRLDGRATNAIFATIQPGAERAVREEVLDGAQTDVVARASLLVPRAGQNAFLEAITLASEECRGWGYVVAVSGPWPPYRFGGLQAEEATDGKKH